MYIINIYFPLYFFILYLYFYFTYFTNTLILHIKTYTWNADCSTCIYLSSTVWWITDRTQIYPTLSDGSQIVHGFNLLVRHHTDLNNFERNLNRWRCFIFYTSPLDFQTSTIPWTLLAHALCGSYVYDISMTADRTRTRIALWISHGSTQIEQVWQEFID